MTSGRRSGTGGGARRNAARRNVRKAARVAKKRRTIANLPKKTRTALGKQANKVKRQRRSSGKGTGRGTR